MKNFNSLLKRGLSSVIGPKTDRHWTDNGPRTLIAILFLLFTLGIGDGWGSTKTTTFKNYSSGTWATNKNPLPYESGGVAWAATATPNSFESASPSRYIQWTSGSIKNTSFTITNTSLASYSIAKVSLVASTNSNANLVHISVSVGGTSFGSADMSKTNNTTYNFPSTGQNAATGNIVITISGDNNSNTKSFYLKSITVTYCAVPTSPTNGTITASTADLSWTDAASVGHYDVYCSTSSTAPAINATPTVSGITTTSTTVTGLSGSNTYYWWVRAYDNDCKSKWVAGTSFDTPSAGCSNYSFHSGSGEDATVKTSNTATCFTQVSTSTTWKIEDYTIPSDTKFFVGYQGYFYNDGLGSNNSRSAVKTWSQEMFFEYTKNYGDGYRPTVGQATGAKGTLYIWSDNNWNNLHVGFSPQGYVFKLGSTNLSMSGSATLDADRYWETEVVTLTSSDISGNYQTNLYTGSAGGVASDNTQSSSVTGMGVKTNAGNNWRAAGISSAADANTRGFFRIDIGDGGAKNWNAHWVPTHRIIYHSNYPAGGGPADTYSTDVSVEETKSDIALPSAPTAPTGYTFAGWYDAASGGTKKTGNQTISAGASADPEYYAHWYGITLVVKDEDGTTLSGDGKPTLTRSGLSLTATTAGNYVFKDIQITSGTGTLSSTSSTTPTITAISSDITVTATFYKPISVTKGTNTGAATFTLSATEVARGGNVTITCAADATHKGNPTITATSGNYTTISVASATSASVNGITGPVTINISYAAKETATVKLHVAGSTSTISGTRYEGDSYTLPSEAAECPDMGLYGWYTTDYEHATTAPSGANFKLPGASATLVAGDNDFYAVYATVTPDAANTYTKITSTGELVTGDYLLVAYYSSSYIEAMKNTVNASDYMDEVNVKNYVNNTTTPTKVTLESDNSAIRWRITKSTSTITIYNAAVSKYFCGSTGTPALNTTSEDFSYSVTSGDWALVTNSKTVYYSNQWYVGTPSTAKPIYLFKRDPSIAGPYTTSPSCTTHTLTVNMDPVAPDGCSAAAVKTVLGETKTTTATATAGDHYVFSYWTISGTGSTMSNTSDGKSTDNPVTVTMGTADATLTAHFVEKEKCTVVFKNNGTQLSSTTYWRGENPVAPTLTDGTDHDACDETSDKHFGWTQTAWSNTLEQAAIDAKTDADVKVYAKDATLPAITAGDDGTTITYHAVWAKVTGGETTISIDGSGLQAVVKDQTIGYDDFDFSVGGYTFHVSAATKCTDSGTAQYWFQLKKNNDAITIPTLPGKITNISSTAIRTATSGSVSTGVYFNSSATTSAAIASETLSSATSFSLDVTGNNSSGYLLFGAATCINQLSVTYSTASYSKYLTTCCEYIVDAPTVTGTPTKNSITLSWTNVTGATGYTVTSSGGTPGDVSSDGTARSCVITGLSPNTNYTWSVVATYTTPYCLANTANGNTTTSQVYAVSYNKNGGTIANLPSGGTYAAGEEVTVAAKPDGTVSKSGYTFTGWNTQDDGLGTHYDADGTKSFTMPSEAVVLYAEWTAKKNYFVDRMHGNWDGEHTEPTTGYNCYLREGAGYTVPDLSDDDTGSNSCVTGHAHFVGWVASGKIDTQGGLKSGYTIIKGGTSGTATVDGTIYYAVWAEE